MGEHPTPESQALTGWVTWLNFCKRETGGWVKTNQQEASKEIWRSKNTKKPMKNMF